MTNLSPVRALGINTGVQSFEDVNGSEEADRCLANFDRLSFCTLSCQGIAASDVIFNSLANCPDFWGHKPVRESLYWVPVFIVYRIWDGRLTTTDPTAETRDSLQNPIGNRWKDDGDGSG